MFLVNLLILIFPMTDFATKLTNYKHVRIKVQIKIPHIDKPKKIGAQNASDYNELQHVERVHYFNLKL